MTNRELQHPGRITSSESFDRFNQNGLVERVGFGLVVAHRMGRTGHRSKLCLVAQFGGLLVQVIVRCMMVLCPYPCLDCTVEARSTII